MKSKPAVLVAALLVLSVLIAACTQKTSEAPAQPVTVQEAEAAAADVPEIAQAEQSVQEIGTEDLKDIDQDLDTLILP